MFLKNRTKFKTFIFEINRKTSRDSNYKRYNFLQTLGETDGVFFFY